MKRVYFNSVKVLSIHQGIVCFRLSEKYDENGHVMENVAAELCSDIETLAGVLGYLKSSIGSTKSPIHDETSSVQGKKATDAIEDAGIDDEHNLPIIIATKFVHD